MRDHIRKRSKDGWTVVVSWQEDGKRRQEWEAVRGPKRNAEARLAELLTMLNNGTVSQETVELLKDHRRKQLEYGLATGLGRFELVFPNKVGGIWRPNDVGNRFSALARSIGIDCTLHTLRHTHATMLL